jgi:polysaccharide export outer membrane protein
MVLVRAITILLCVWLSIPSLSVVAVGAPAAPASYVLGPGDSIDIVVFGQPDLSQTVTIKPDGMVALPLVGEMKATGRTTAQFQDDLVKAYRAYLKAPSVEVKISQFRTSRIYVLGEVARPGQYEVKPNDGLLELLAAAGGPTPRADLAKAVLIRNKNETTKLDLLGAIKEAKDPPVALEPEDVVFIPETDARIIILGQVNHPGAYQLLEGQHATDLIAGAGGPTPQAALTQAFVVRGTQQIPVDLKKAMDGDTSANIVLEPRDMMVVPESRERIAVFGQVNKPGPYDFKPDMKIVDAVALAGGPTDKANLGQIHIVRLEGGKAKTINVDFNKVEQGQDPSQNVALQSGDLVYVAAKGFTLDMFNSALNYFLLFRP